MANEHKSDGQKQTAKNKNNSEKDNGEGIKSFYYWPVQR